MDDNLAKSFLSFLREYEKRSSAIMSQEYNVFHVMSKAMVLEDETNCALLLDWLNPNGHHRQGNLFLKAFLLKLGVKPELADHSDWKVLDHPYLGSFSPDIVIRNEFHGFLFLVELKIKAQDHSDQLNKYYKYLMDQTNIDSGRKMLVYLTVDGCDPANFSSTSINPKHFMKLSLQKDIYDWLESVLPEIRNKAVTATISNYLSALPRIVDEAQGNNIQSEIVRYLSKPEFLPMATFIRKKFEKISGSASGPKPIFGASEIFRGWMTRDGSTDPHVIKSIRKSGLYLQERTPDGASYPIEFFADIKQGIVRVGITCNRVLTPDLSEIQGFGELKYWLQQRGFFVPTIPSGNELGWRNMGSEAELTEKSDYIRRYLVQFMGEFHEMVAALNRLMLEHP